MRHVRTSVLAVAAVLAVTGCTSSSKKLSPPAQPDSIYAAAAACVAGTVPATTPRDPLPALTLPCLTGAKSELNLRAVAGGKPTIVTLWAHWCGPCLKELPAMQRAYAAGKVAVLGVNTLDDAGPAGALLKDLTITFPSVYDLAGRTLDAIKNARPALPLTLFVDPQGEIRGVSQTGSLDDAALASAMQQYLGV